MKHLSKLTSCLILLVVSSGCSYVNQLKSEDPTVASQQIVQTSISAEQKAKLAINFICTAAKVGTPIAITVEEYVKDQNNVATTTSVGHAISEDCNTVNSIAAKLPAIPTAPVNPLVALQPNPVTVINNADSLENTQQYQQ